MANLYLIQLVGVMLATAGIISFAASAHLFGTPLSPAERWRASDEWNRRRDIYRLPLSVETIASMLFLLGGIGILAWSDFSLCAFLAYWLPSLPDAVTLLFSCK
jgi:hypothetical protein